MRADAADKGIGAATHSQLGVMAWCCPKLQKAIQLCPGPTSSKYSSLSGTCAMGEATSNRGTAMERGGEMAVQSQ